MESVQKSKTNTKSNYSEFRTSLSLFALRLLNFITSKENGIHNFRYAGIRHSANKHIFMASSKIEVT